MVDKKLLLGGLGLFVLGLAFGRYTLPAKIETKIEVQTVIKEVVKTVEVDKSEEHRNKILRETVTQKPDGTIITKRIWIDKTVVLTEETKNNDKTTDTTTISTSDTTTTYDVNKYSINFMVGKQLDNFDIGSYGVSVSKKFLGPITLGVFGFTNKTLGVSVGLVF